MDINSEDQALFRQYQNLPKSSRQAILRGILDQMPREGWREIKALADVHTFQYDILGKLPSELAALVAEYLPLIDIIRLRRVSQRWQQVLSSPSLCRAAVRATLGKDPWALSSPESQLNTHATGTLTSTLTVSSDTMVSASTVGPGQDITSYSTTSFTKIVRRRHRLEQGNPSKITTIPFPIEGMNNGEDVDPRAFVSYSGGSYAWLDPKEDQTTVVIFNLFNDDRKKLTTENREKLTRLRFSKPFVAAVSVRGYCHVWNIDTFESSSFRIPSIHLWDMLVSGTKVLVQFYDYAVHWCFNTRIARTVNMKFEFVVTLALHPSEDQITTVCIDSKDKKQHWNSVPLQDCQMHIEKYALGSRSELCLASSRYQPMSGLVCLEQGIHYAEVSHRGTMLYPGQENVAMEICEQAMEGSSQASGIFCLSVEPDGLVAFHVFPDNVHELACPERGVVYAPSFDGLSANIAVMKSKTTMGPENSWVRYDYYIHHTTPTWKTPWIVGDAHFIIIFGKGKLDIWTMDDPEVEDKKVVNRVDEIMF